MPVLSLWKCQGFQATKYCQRYTGNPITRHELAGFNDWAMSWFAWKPLRPAIHKTNTDEEILSLRQSMESKVAQENRNRTWFNLRRESSPQKKSNMVSVWSNTAVEKRRAAYHIMKFLYHWKKMKRFVARQQTKPMKGQYEAWHIKKPLMGRRKDAI